MTTTPNIEEHPVAAAHRAGGCRARPRAGAMSRPRRSVSLVEGWSALVTPLLEELASRRAALLAVDGPGEVHAMRAALRRLRAAFGLFDEVIPAEDQGWVVHELRWLTRKLGDTRDLDVLLERLRARHCYTPDVRKRDLVVVAAEYARTAAAAEALVIVRGARSTALIEGLNAYAPHAVELLGAEMDLASYATSRLARDATILATRAGRIERLGVRGRHRLRKQVKTLRYNCEGLGWAFSGGDDYVKLLGDLHRILGDMNDDDVSRALVRRLAPSGKTTVLECLGPRVSDLRNALKGACERLVAAKPPWETPSTLVSAATSPATVD